MKQTDCTLSNANLLKKVQLELEYDQVNGSDIFLRKYSKTNHNTPDGGVTSTHQEYIRTIHSHQKRALPKNL